ncbi:hypothetical protein [Alkalicoccobacillus murimartini]|uniref:Uncharacterized protein n=1 Tax=Alkalicoccobacillus murimartini TaxID=171685 RepID=A0ABT9YLU2_9BACI|nr:hypothetical protein [Alkalicoccobacillus murimartini]MDQ0208855.1 hypothetical protein [Alkalicoccobacillus murimartini]
MNTYRITKYNPNNRFENGVYKDQEEWISYSDIGKGQGENGLLTVDEYLRIEDFYIDAILRFMKLHHLTEIRVLKLERYDESAEDFDLYTTNHMKELFHSVQVGRLITTEEIRPVVKLILRNLLWAKLGLIDQLVVTFGHDYYMYLHTNEAISSIKRRIENNGLFVELMPSDLELYL